MPYHGSGRIYFHINRVADITLIGANDQVDANEFGASQEFDLDGDPRNSGTLSAELVSVTLVSRESGTGSVIKPAVDLVFFNSDPSLSAGTTSLSPAQLAAIIGVVSIGTSSFASTLSVAAIGSKAFALPMISDAEGKVWIAPINRSSTSYNDAAGDDELLEAKIQFRRDN
jgi:hypothetical protein